MSHFFPAFVRQYYRFCLFLHSSLSQVISLYPSSFFSLLHFSFTFMGQAPRSYFFTWLFWATITSASTSLTSALTVSCHLSFSLPLSFVPFTTNPITWCVMWLYLFSRHLVTTETHSTEKNLMTNRNNLTKPLNPTITLPLFSEV